MRVLKRLLHVAYLGCLLMLCCNAAEEKDKKGGYIHAMGD